MRAQLLLCMLAYYVQWQMIEAWAERTHKDDQPAGPERGRDPVSPAKRSKAALAKAHTRTPGDATRTLIVGQRLAHLGTIVRNTLRPAGSRPGEATFTLTTQRRQSRAARSISSPRLACSRSPAAALSLKGLKMLGNRPFSPGHFGLEQFPLDVNRKCHGGIPRGVQIRLGFLRRLRWRRVMRKTCGCALLRWWRPAMRRREAARLLDVGASSAIRWIERWTTTGSVAAKPGTGHCRSPLEAHKQARQPAQALPCGQGRRDRHRLGLPPLRPGRPRTLEGIRTWKRYRRRTSTG